MNPWAERRLRGNRPLIVVVSPGFPEGQQQTVLPLLLGSQNLTLCELSTICHCQSEALSEWSHLFMRRRGGLYVDTLSSHVWPNISLAYVKTKFISIKNKLYLCCDFYHLIPYSLMQGLFSWKISSLLNHLQTEVLSICVYSLERINLFQEQELGNQRSQTLGFIYFLDWKSINYITYIQTTTGENTLLDF